jgi:isoleucyl-tRNA synthetase
MLKNLKNLSLPEIERKVLEFWQENNIFEKSLKRGPTRTERGKTRKDYVFYDGPPFATGLPHYGHILASIIKDAIPRYQTMKGKKVPRRWGWDCHGLPIENEIEKDLGLKTKRDIENIGVKNFNEAARKKVLAYASDWKEIIPRIGRWVDMENDYKTMDADYTESVLWIFKTLYEKGLIYEGYKSMHLCPRCETTLSNFEVALNYKEIEDFGITVKFKLEETKNQKLKTKSYLLAWTTTPWTLPGNVALAVNDKIVYAKIQKSKFKNQNDNSKLKNGEFYILAKERLNEVLSGEEYEIIEEFKGKDLIGKKYEPLFDYYYNDKNLKNRENGWKICGADFVSAEEGAGIVHIAPAFGEDDMNLAQKENLPLIQHVSIDGKFKPEVKDFAGLPAKPKDNHQSADIEIIKWLAVRNKLFDKQKITHAYPHCWRCDTPLLNYAASSWFVKVGAMRNRLIKNNKKINWIPAHIRDGRFGKWLEEVRDWAISRTRFWGAPIPVWQCQTDAESRGTNAEQRGKNSCGEQIVIGSLEDLKKHAKKSGNKYFVMRHGEAESNLFNIVSSNYKNEHHLTEKGKKQVKAAAGKFKKINLIFSSDFLRCRETAEIVAEAIGYPKNKIIFDKRLREINTGIFDGGKPKEYHDYFSSFEEKFYKTPPKGENLTELKKRVSEFLYEIDEKYSDKNILIVSHEYPIWTIFAGAAGADSQKAIEIRKGKPDFLKTAEIKKLDFIPIPHNDNFELDFHRPYIDEIEFPCKCGGAMKRIPDVFDCWFESGAMPFAQARFPFTQTNTDKSPYRSVSSLRKSAPVPAEFIAEGIDQTRGWFYTLLVLSTALFNKPAYKNVIVNGIILSETGQKMSKRLKNYPDPMEIVNKYGADALRLYLLSSPAVRAENLNFSEKGVDEIYKKVIMRLWNSYQFYELYADKCGLNADRRGQVKSANALDKWILARLNQLIAGVSEAMDDYELDKATRPIGEFVDDLSTWYIRRSRERFRNENKDKKEAMTTTRFVLTEFSKIIAPFAPFMAEAVYQNVKCQMSNVKCRESVHLEEWPTVQKSKACPVPKRSFWCGVQSQKSKVLLEAMTEVRKICSLGLEARQKAGIKVRQPIASLKIKNQKSKIKDNEELLNLIKDEVNVKEIVFDAKIKNEVELDTVITAELKAEGDLRELARLIQDLRKNAGLTPKDKISLYLRAPKEIEHIVAKFLKDFQKKIGAKTIEFYRTEKFDAEEETQIDGQKIWIGLKKT